MLVVVWATRYLRGLQYNYQRWSFENSAMFSIVYVLPHNVQYISISEEFDPTSFFR
jgi:hypothetical protein